MTVYIRVTNVDTYGDVLSLDSITDTVDHTVATDEFFDILLPSNPFLIYLPSDTDPSYPKYLTVSHAYTVKAGDVTPLRDIAYAHGCDPGVYGYFDLKYPGAIPIIPVPEMAAGFFSGLIFLA